MQMGETPRTEEMEATDAHNNNNQDNHNEGDANQDSANQDNDNQDDAMKTTWPKMTTGNNNQKQPRQKSDPVMIQSQPKGDPLG